jgi:preprotein translocase subunit SecG
MTGILIALRILLGVTSLLLTLLILLHKGRGGGLSDMFGGGINNTMGSSGVAEYIFIDSAKPRV